MDSYSLKSVLDLPAPFRSVFKFRYFNSLQSECFPVCFQSDINMVISAPTGSGKTVLFELCILRLLSRFICRDGNFVHVKGTLKTIYVAPSKALVQEKLRDWSLKFGSWGIICLELTGDNESYSTKSIQEADIILTTPENDKLSYRYTSMAGRALHGITYSSKSVPSLNSSDTDIHCSIGSMFHDKFDAVSRYRIKDGGLSFFSDIALLLIDEVHLLNDLRGAVLEAIVSRFKMLARKPELKSSTLASARFLAVSATIPNIEDLAEWLDVPEQGIKRFGEEMRPVKLTTKVFGYTPAKNDFLFEKRLENYIFDILMQYSRGKSALVFCSTRKGAQEAAQKITQTAMTFGFSNPFIKSREQQERLREASLSCSDKQMQSYILYGVGYHNGGLSMKDRNLVEGLFLNGDLQVLCTTNTLAHGINLPAHTVVIKSTQHFNKEKGQYMEYERSTILQMSGRAGRPPFDDTGMVVIMTRRETVHLYENLLSGCETVESQLFSCVMEHLNAEIVQLTVTDIARAIEWMKCSYLYVRMKKNPENYAVKKGIPRDYIEKHIQGVCVQNVNELSCHQMVQTDEDGFLLKPLEPGRLMTKYYLKFNTMKHIMKTPSNCSLEDTLLIICSAEEISWIQLRRNEKKLLNDINADKDSRLRFHVTGDNGKRKKRIQTKEEKLFVLANDCLTGDPLVHDLTMTQDAISICSSGCRIAKCMKEYFTYKKSYRGAVNSALLAKSLSQKLWDDSPYLLKQLPGIGMVTAKALHSMGVKSFEALAEADPRRIEIVTGRKYPFGNHIKESLMSLPPKLDLKIEEIEHQRPGKSKLEVTLTRLSQSVQSIKRHYADMIVGSEEENLILFHEKISPYVTSILLPKGQGKQTLKADIIFEEYIGIDIHQKVVLAEESRSKPSPTRQKKLTKMFAPPEQICIIEDDKPKHREHTPMDPVRAEKESSDMPSFNLLDEDLLEGEPATNSSEEDCTIISERTIFDHIREKAKKFPQLTTSNSSSCPTSGSAMLKRKRLREQHIEPFIDLDAVEGAGKTKAPRQIAKSQESRYPEQDLDIPNYPTTTVGVAKGDVPSEVEDPPLSKAMTEDAIFDHIRKKSRNFPMLNTPTTIDSDFFFFRDMKPRTPTEFSGISSSSSTFKIDTAAADRATNATQSAMKFLPFDISMLKKNSSQLVCNFGTSQDPLKEKVPPAGSPVLCSTEIRGEPMFLGFQSVFSFL